MCCSRAISTCAHDGKYLHAKGCQMDVEKVNQLSQTKEARRLPILTISTLHHNEPGHDHIPMEQKMVDPAKYPRILPPYIMSKELKESDLGLFLLLVFLTEGLSVFLGMSWLSSSGILKSQGADYRQYEHNIKIRIPFLKSSFLSLV